jgi:hypothetical protein
LRTKIICRHGVVFFDPFRGALSPLLCCSIDKYVVGRRQMACCPASKRSPNPLAANLFLSLTRC